MTEEEEDLKTRLLTSLVQVGDCHVPKESITKMIRQQSVRKPTSSSVFEELRKNLIWRPVTVVEPESHKEAFHPSHTLEMGEAMRIANEGADSDLALRMMSSMSFQHS